MKVKYRDKLRQDLTIVLNTINKQELLAVKLGISLTSLRDLATIIRIYIKTLEPVKSFDILRDINTSGTNYRLLYGRILTLMKYGLIINTNKNDNTMLLIPTDKALREFKEIFNCVD